MAQSSFKNFIPHAKVLKNLKEVDLSQPDNVLRGAVTIDKKIEQFLPMALPAGVSPSAFTYTQFDKNEEISAFVKRLAAQLGLTAASNADSSEYSLMHDNGRFLTDANKHSLRMGFMLSFSASPLNYARTLLSKSVKCQGDPDIESFQHFSSLCADNAFVEALITPQICGSRALISAIESGVFEPNLPALNLLLQSLLTLMDHEELFDFEKVQELEESFIERISMFVNGQSKSESNSTIFLAMSILNRIFANSPVLEEKTRSKVKFETLIRHLAKRDERILLQVLILMNTIYERSTVSEKENIQLIIRSKPFIDSISSAIEAESKCRDDKIRLQFLLIQEIIFDSLKRSTLLAPLEKDVNYVLTLDYWSRHAENPQATVCIRDASLRKSSSFDFAERLTHKTSCVVEESEELNSENRTKDIEAFKDLVQQSPPGSLALEAILHYVKHSREFTDDRTNVRHGRGIIRQSAWPNIMARLTKALVLILGVVDEDRKMDLHQFVLKSENPFFDLFAATIALFKLTWREMKAEMYDIDKVFLVVQRQLELAIAEHPSSVEEMKLILKRKFSYPQMNELWERERVEKEELEFTHPQIKALCDHLRPGIESLVLQRRKNRLKNGCLFMRDIRDVTTRRGVQNSDTIKHSLMRLEENEHFLVCTNSQLSLPTARSGIARQTVKDEGPDSKIRIPISRVRKIFYGSEYSSRMSQQSGIKAKKPPSSPHHTAAKFGLLIENDEQQQEELSLIGSDEGVLAPWVEALNCLLDPKAALESPELKAEVDSLLKLEVRVRLLDLPLGCWNREVCAPAYPKDLSWIAEQYKHINRKSAG